MNRIIIFSGVLLALILGAGAIYWSQYQKPLKTTSSHPASNASSSTESSGTTTITNKSTSTINGVTTIAPVDIHITADDYHANQTSINVTKGAKVTITFMVEQEAEYSDGLVFRTKDSSLNTGTIKPGTSKSLTFTANDKVEFLPFWPNGGPQKNYTVTVNAS